MRKAKNSREPFVMTGDPFVMKAGLRVRVSGALNLALNELRRTRAQIAATAVAHTRPQVLRARMRPRL